MQSMDAKLDALSSLSLTVLLEKTRCWSPAKMPDRRVFSDGVPNFSSSEAGDSSEKPLTARQINRLAETQSLQEGVGHPGRGGGRKDFRVTRKGADRFRTGEISAKDSTDRDMIINREMKYPKVEENLWRFIVNGQQNWVWLAIGAAPRLFTHKKFSSRH